MWPGMHTFGRDAFAGRILAVEGTPLVCDPADPERPSCKYCASCFREGRDIVIPSFVDDWRQEQIRQARRPWTARPYLFSYHGSGFGPEDAIGPGLIFCDRKRF